MDIERLKEEAVKMSDPRRAYGNLRHKHVDIIIMGLMSLISMGEDFVDMEIFGKNRETWLRTFLEPPQGIPDSDTFRRVFEKLNPKELSECLNHWLETARDRGAVINIDGKTIRGSKNVKHKAYHVVSAWVVENQIALGEIKTEEKSNEITAVPELLDMLDIEGSIITADAMSCQKAIAEKITEKKADYVIGLKGNQGTLQADVALIVETENAGMEQHQKSEKSHGRLETRTAYVTHDIAWYENHKAWPGLTCFGAVRRVCEVNAKVSDETRYYISSRKLSAKELLNYSRNEWGVESMHWLLDVIYNEDRTLLMEKDALRTLNTLRKTALNLARMYKISLSPKSSLVGIMRNNLFNPQSILAFFKRLGSIKELCPN